MGQRKQIDDETVRLQREKIDLLDAQVKDLKAAIGELKAAGAADAQTIATLKQAVERSEKEVKRLRGSRGLARKIGWGLFIAGAAVGYLVGNR